MLERVIMLIGLALLLACAATPTMSGIPAFPTALPVSPSQAFHGSAGELSGPDGEDGLYDWDFEHGVLHHQAGDWDLAVGGQWSLNLVRYGNDNQKSSGFETDRGSIILRGEGPRGLRFWIEPDVDGENTPRNLWEAWAELPLGDKTWVRAGQMRMPLGTEYATRDEVLPLVGYGFTSYLDGIHDVGVRADGYVTNGVWWELVGSAGHGFGLQGRRRSDARYSGRIVVTAPADERQVFEGPFGGLAYAMGSEYSGPVQLATPLDQTVFSTAHLDGDDQTWFHWELGWRSRRFRFGFEDATGEIEDVPQPGGGTQTYDQLTSYVAYVTFNIRGEAAVWRRGRWEPVRVDQRDELPIELSFRYSNADIDRDLFDSPLTKPNASTQEVRTFSAALGTWLDDSSRLTFQWVNMIADHEINTFGGDNRDQSYVVRWDKRF